MALKMFLWLYSKNALANVAKTAKDEDVCKAALERLPDQSVLVDVAKNAKYSDVRKMAAERLTDLSELADVAKTAEDEDVRKMAVERLADQSALADVAKNAKCCGKWEICRIAIERLTDQVLLADVAQSSSFRARVSVTAAQKLTDYALAQRVYAEVAKDNTIGILDHMYLQLKSEHKALSTATWRETDVTKQRALFFELQGASGALNLIFDRKLQDGWEFDFRLKAATMLTDPTLLADVAMNAKDYNICDTALQRLTDQSLLADVAKNSENANVRTAATRRLTNL